MLLTHEKPVSQRQRNFYSTLPHTLSCFFFAFPLSFHDVEGSRKVCKHHCRHRAHAGKANNARERESIIMWLSRDTGCEM